jgi:hypothetical protein
MLTEETLRRLVDKEAVKAGLLINALRVGLTGQGVAPGLFEIMQVLARRRTMERLKRLGEYLRLTIDDFTQQFFQSSIYNRKSSINLGGL